jgi:hypothetical protein
MVIFLPDQIYSPLALGVILSGAQQLGLDMQLITLDQDSWAS